jgi:hypothetical protein
MKTNLVKQVLASRVVNPVRLQATAKNCMSTSDLPTGLTSYSYKTMRLQDTSKYTVRSRENTKREQVMGNSGGKFK